MVFREIPTKLRMPAIPGLSFDPSSDGKSIWVNYARRTTKCAALYCSQLSSYIIVGSDAGASALCFSVGNYTVLWTNCNGFCAFHSGSMYIWRSVRWAGWVLTSCLPGVEPEETETTDSGTTTHGGDSFWLCSSWPSYSDGSSVTFAPRGAERDAGSAVVLSLSWDRWQNGSTSPAGEYAAKCGASGSIVLGLRTWTDGSGRNYTKSMSEDSTGHFSYGAAHYDADAVAWIIGTWGADSGWNQSAAEPSASGSTTFSFTAPEGSSASGSDIVLSYSGLSIGENKSAISVCEASIWR